MGKREQLEELSADTAPCGKEPRGRHWQETKKGKPKPKIQRHLLHEGGKDMRNVEVDAQVQNYFSEIHFCSRLHMGNEHCSRKYN